MTRIRGGVATETPIASGDVRAAALELFGVRLPAEKMLFENAVQQ